MFHIIDTVNKKDQRLIGLIFGSNRITLVHLNFSGDVPLFFVFSYMFSVNQALFTRSCFLYVC